MGDTRPTEPILDGDLKDPKVFYHNAAYKTNRVAINLEKMKARRSRREGGRGHCAHAHARCALRCSVFARRAGTSGRAPPCDGGT
jgi:hypothetical protein